MEDANLHNEKHARKFRAGMTFNLEHVESCCISKCELQDNGVRKGNANVLSVKNFYTWLLA